MNSGSVKRGIIISSMALLILAAIGCQTTPTSSEPDQAAAKYEPKHFATPDEAGQALLAAFERGTDDALLEVFGSRHENLIVVTDRVARQQELDEMVRAMGEGYRFEGNEDVGETLIIGRESWPFPIPLVKGPAGWWFDADAGADEILNRRIGANELEAIANCRVFLAAQIEYASRDRDKDGVREYAQKVKSSPGKKDGLYWPVDPDSGEPLSPFGPFIAGVPEEYISEARKGEKIPYHGYFYHILTQQGPDAPGGKYNYVINGNMIAGFGLIAYPADYGSSGIMTFVVSHHGKVYEKDLGDNTLEIARKTKTFNPDSTWNVLQE